MKVIVPLAGPDFENPDGTVKSEALFNGIPLIRLALEGRSWWRCHLVNDADLIFVLRNTPVSRRFASEKLSHWYPNCRQVFLSASTIGAALSALAGLSLVSGASEPICIDLVDILYTCEIDPTVEFRNSSIGALAIVFDSTNPVYSYLRTDDCGEVVEVAEKKVISRRASVGTYFFSSAATFLVALARNLRNPDAVTHNSLFFVCPVLAGVLEEGLRVAIRDASDVRDLKTGISEAGGVA